MNRKQRRAERKLSRDATPAEIFPGEHGPVQSTLSDLMPDLVRMIQNHIGRNYTVTLFIAEAEAPAGENREPRFNYVSSANREDMIAVLEAFVLKQRAAGAKLDKIGDEPPTETKQ